MKSGNHLIAMPSIISSVRNGIGEIKDGQEGWVEHHLGWR
jgi:hypothetical protein